MIIEKEATGFNNREYCLYLTDSCRDAIKQILMMGNGSKKILIPAYVGLSTEEGSGILDPVKETFTEFAFYKVDLQLDPELESLENMLKDFRPTHVLVVNYFGFLLSNRKDVFELLANYEVITVEDFAHLIEPLRKHSDTPMLANYEVFSLHKTIGAKIGGGALLCETAKESITETISNSALKLFAKSDLNLISHLRSRNYNYLNSRLNWHQNKIFTPFFFDGRNPVLPLNLPIRLSSLELRHELYNYLTKEGIFPTALYHRLVPELHEENFPVSLQISQTILNLPTHQDVDLEELDILLQLLKVFCDEK